MLIEKNCTRCLRLLSISQFGPQKAGANGLQSRCKECLAELQRTLRAANREKIRAYYKAYRLKNLEREREKDRRYRARNPEIRRQRCRQWKESLKLEMITAYGGKCRCCGECSHPAFMTIDHIFNDGYKERHISNKANFYYHLKKLEWPQDRYQLLCWNCNMAKAKNGNICPHEEARLKAA